MDRASHLPRHTRRASCLVGSHRTAAAALDGITILVLFPDRSLWEAFEAAVMDQALSVHHACVRKAIAAWGGYESATGGSRRHGRYRVRHTNHRHRILRHKPRAGAAAPDVQVGHAWPSAAG